MIKRQFLVIVFFLCASLMTFGQKILRDTTVFKEHQVVFEQMDYITHTNGIKIFREYRGDTSRIVTNADPYWISPLVTNSDYSDYLKALKNDSTSEKYNNALLKETLLNESVQGLNITLREYFTNQEYSNYPVLGLNWYQAQNYCDWKTSIVNKELQQAKLPIEKSFRIPKQIEIESAKRFIDINKPRIAKIDSTYDVNEIINFSKRINEWTSEAFVELTYLNKISSKEESDKIVIYRKEFKANTFEEKKNGYSDIGFRLVQTYRNVKNSE
jgi:hypothetical protein